MERPEMGKWTIDEFLERLGSGSAAPGGGAASALGGAMGAALLEMAANLTIGRPKYAPVEQEMRAILARAATAKARLAALARADMAAYEAVMAAYGLPREGTAAETRLQRIQEAFVEATEVPLAVATQAVELLDLALPLAERGNRNAVGDIAAAGSLASAAAECALQNVEINLGYLQAGAFTERTQRAAKTLNERREELKRRLGTVVQERH